MRLFNPPLWETCIYKYTFTWSSLLTDGAVLVYLRGEYAVTRMLEFVLSSGLDDRRQTVPVGLLSQSPSQYGYTQRCIVSQSYGLSYLLANNLCPKLLSNLYNDATAFIVVDFFLCLYLDLVPAPGVEEGDEER